MFVTTQTKNKETHNGFKAKTNVYLCVCLDEIMLIDKTSKILHLLMYDVYKALCQFWNSQESFTSKRIKSNAMEYQIHGEAGWPLNEYSWLARRD